MSLYPAVILAGGLATRLRPLTMTLPKSLIPINHEPFIVHQLRLLKKNNIRQVVMCIGYLGEQIIDFISDGKKYDMDVTYSSDGETLLGTAGAIKKALPLLGDSFFVLYGDSYLMCDYAAIQKSFIEEDKLSLMTVHENKNLWDKSNVDYRNKKIINYDKVNRTETMHHIDYGLGMFQASAFDSLPANEAMDLADLYKKLLSENQLSAYEVSQRFYEIGSLSGIKELENLLTIA